VQRRHQKVIEEAPSPAVSPELRERMGATAVAAVKAIGYEGAGTLEFLLDRDGNYYFMEMNTRLQVEHPVTESITGLDLVELQLRVAAGEPLPLAQCDVSFSGHAIEVRLCAEDVDKGFMPQSGTVAVWQVPDGLRVENALGAGSAISPYYDSMIAKIISHGRSRDEARRKLIRGLEDVVALGVTTNQVFLARCLAHPVFVAGGATTAFIGQHVDTLLAPDDELRQRAAAVAALLLHETAGDRGRRPAGRTLTHSLAIPLRFDVDGRRCDGRLSLQNHQRFGVVFGERSFELALIQLGHDRARFVCDGVMESATFHRDGTRLLLHYRGTPFVIDDHARAATMRQGEGGGDGKLRASMNGRVVAVLVAVGDSVEAGQPMVTLEAMKMEHIHAAPVAGKVSALHVATGDQVAASRVVAEIEPSPLSSQPS
jgi:geranyl-CoA carboxylase alpha subunit